MIARIALVAAALASTASLAACTPSSHKPSTARSAHASGDVVTGTAFSRNGSRKIYYAECATPAGKGYQVVVSAKVAGSLKDGQPCPAGKREPLPKDRDPELFNELQKKLPYGGGDRNSACGEWQTVDKEEARRWAKQCPPLKWGDLR